MVPYLNLRWRFFSSSISLTYLCLSIFPVIAISYFSRFVSSFTPMMVPKYGSLSAFEAPLHAAAVTFYITHFDSRQLKQQFNQFHGEGRGRISYDWLDLTNLTSVGTGASEDVWGSV